MIIDPKSVSPTDVYKVMVGTIVPRPIAWVSSVSEAGLNNLAPFSFFTGASADPPIVCFAPIRNARGGFKDTRCNIESTRDFVVNVVSENLTEKMNITAALVAPEVDEFEIAGLTAVPSELVKAPRILEARVSMECRLVQIIEFGERPLGGCLVVGEIVLFHVDDECIDNFRIDPDKLKAVGRMAGSTYVRTTDRFDVIRP